MLWLNLFEFCYFILSKPASGEIFGQNWYISYCFQVLLITCWHLSRLFYINLRSQSINSSEVTCSRREFDSAWGGVVKGLILTQNNLVVVWKVKPHMGIISWLPFGVRCFSCNSLILIPFCNWFFLFNLCQKREERRNNCHGVLNFNHLIMKTQPVYL